MKTKDSSARMMRLAQRNALITALFYELTTREGESFMQAYVFLETIFGIDGRQIRKILCQKSKVELSSTNVTKFAVLLQSLTLRLGTNYVGLTDAKNTAGCNPG